MWGTPRAEVMDMAARKRMMNDCARARVCTSLSEGLHFCARTWSVSSVLSLADEVTGQVSAATCHHQTSTSFRVWLLRSKLSPLHTLQGRCGSSTTICYTCCFTLLSCCWLCFFSLVELTSCLHRFFSPAAGFSCLSIRCPSGLSRLRVC